MKAQIALVFLLSVAVSGKFLPVFVGEPTEVKTASSALMDFTTGFFIKIKALDEIPDAYTCVIQLTSAQQAFQNLTDLIKNFDFSKIPEIVNLVNNTINEVKSHCSSASAEGQAFFHGILSKLNNATFRAEGTKRLFDNWLTVINDINSAKTDFNNQSFTNAGMDLGDIAAIFLYEERAVASNHLVNLAELAANSSISIQDFLMGLMVSIGAIDKIPHGYPCGMQLDSIKNATNFSISLLRTNLTVDNVALAIKVLGNALSDFVEQCGYAAVEGKVFFGAIYDELQNATFRAEASQRLQDNWLKVLEDVNNGNNDVKAGNGFMAGMDFGDIAKIYLTPSAKAVPAIL